MRHKKPLPSQELLQELLDYNPASGELTWKFRPWIKYSWNSRWAGKKAGSVHQKGYIELQIGNVGYLAHLIIWKIVYGCDPIEVDHKDGNRANNAISNLRECTSQLNKMNREAHNKNGLPKGVYLRPWGKYQARIGYNYRMLNLGMFDTPEEAAIVYRAKAVELYGEFAHGGV